MMKLEKNIQNMMFLLSASAMTFACDKDDSSGDKDTGSDGDTKADANTAGGETTGMATDGMDGETGGGGMGQSDENDGGTSDAGDTDRDDTGNEQSGGAEDNQARAELCRKWAEKMEMCSEESEGETGAEYDYDAEYSEQVCLEGFEEYEGRGTSCLEAYESWLVCLSAADCSEINSEDTIPCEAETFGFVAECG